MSAISSLRDLRFPVARLLGSIRYSSNYDAYKVPGLIPPPSDYKRGLDKKRQLKLLPDNAFVFGQIVVPPKVPSIHQSGDLEGPAKVDLSQPTLLVRGCKLLEDADEITKKLVSLEFAPARETNKLVQHDAIAKVQRHKYDKNSPEAKVAKLTVQIRSLLQLTSDRRDVKSRELVKEKIEKRGKILKYMAKFDVERLKWLTQTLNMVYIPNKGYVVSNLTLKGFYQQKCTEYCRKIREQKVLAYRDQLRKQQPEFEEEKKKTFAWIEEQLKKYEIKPEEVDTSRKPTDWGAMVPPDYKFPEMPTPPVVPPPME